MTKVCKVQVNPSKGVKGSIGATSIEPPTEWWKRHENDLLD